MATMSTRDPYPFPRLENDEKFYGCRPQQVAPKTNSWTIFKNSNEVYGVPTFLAQQQEPWNRLNVRHTMSSSRHEVYHHDPRSPRDSLDIVLTGLYDHHEDLLKNKNEILFQPVTFDKDNNGRKLKNRVVTVARKPLEMKHPITVSCQEKMESVHSIKNAVGMKQLLAATCLNCLFILLTAGAHSEETNNGYSRKSDGGFFVF